MAKKHRIYLNAKQKDFWINYPLSIIEIGVYYKVPKIGTIFMLGAMMLPKDGKIYTVRKAPKIDSIWQSIELLETIENIIILVK